MTMEPIPKLSRAPELYGDYWLNSEPVSISALRGYVILLDFWDYSSAGCVRSLPYVNEWHRKYREFGLVVIGVHTPEFKFGKKPEHVARAIQEMGISYPVVMDNEGIIWTAFANRNKPTRSLIDKDGFVRYSNSGEGNPEEFERAIQILLMDAGMHGELPALMEPIRDTDRHGAMCYRQSADVALGYLRGTFGNVEGFSPESTVEHDDPGLHLPGRFYAKGIWTNGRECMRFGGGENGYILANYEAMEVNAVLHGEGGKACTIIVEQDGLMLNDGNKGEDVMLDEKGFSRLHIGSPRSYHIVQNKEFGGHTLKLRPLQGGVEIYSLSFSTGVIPELISNN